MITLDPPPSWNLPAASEFAGSWVSGGQQTLHELAVAAAAAGYEVELRGQLSIPLLDALADATGARPETPPQERRPDAGDIVIISEGGGDPLRFARVVLSPARVVLAILAPTGLFGWPFTAQPYERDPTTIPLRIVGRREHYEAVAALGIDIWTPMPRVQELATSAGARATLIGSGNPLAISDVPKSKSIDVSYLSGSRWQPVAEQVAALIRRPVHAIPVGGHAEVLDSIANSKLLLWLARVEGHGRVLWEARSVGTVVIGLASNVYATGLDEGSGAIAVKTIEEIPAVVERLLGDPVALARLSEAGRRTAAEQVDWRRYVSRVGEAVERVKHRDVDAAADARGAFGKRIDEVFVHPRATTKTKKSAAQQAVDGAGNDHGG